MPRNLLRRLTLAVAVAVAGLPAAGASGAVAAPANDQRGSAERLGTPPVTVRGTTVDATTEAGEPPSCRGETTSSVWYELPGGSAKAAVLVLRAAGDLDAVVDVYERTRSQLTSVGCKATNRRGEAILDFDRRAASSYLIRIAALPNSATDAFTLTVAQPDEPADRPGRRLGRAGANGTLDRITNPDDAWAVRLLAGRSYRVNLHSRGTRCAAAEVYGPGGGSFAGDSPVRSLRCNQYMLLTPAAGETGTYSIRPVAPRASRGAIPYHVQVAPAGPDDTAPGRFIGNDAVARGTLRGSRIDVVDLYRFDVTSRSRLDLQLRTADSHRFDLRLLSSGGRRLACACGDSGSQQIERRLRPGRYFAAVRARRGDDGSYRLFRLSRTVTRTVVTIDGRRSATAAPGQSVRIAADVAPNAAGPVTFDIERFDPLAGWQFFARRHAPAVSGRASIAFLPPSVGRWRVFARFEGTRRASPSGPSRAALLVAGPLAD
jgi:hypothetical protein